MRTFVWPLLLTPLVAVGLAAQDKPDFSGNWRSRDVEPGNLTSAAPAGGRATVGKSRQLPAAAAGEPQPLDGHDE
jgi:hypothetical protein